MTSRPNVLVFLPDAMNAALVASPECITPAFDRLRARGVSFSHATTPSPTCSPARASLMTGLLPHSHGVLQVEHCVDDDQSVLRDVPHWAQRLQEAGYATGYFGKWHIERSEELQSFGWEESVSWRSPLYKSSAAELPDAMAHLDPQLQGSIQAAEGYRPWPHWGVTDVPVAERNVSLPTHFASEWLDKRGDDDRPWCAFVSFPEPNEQLICSRESWDRYDGVELPMPATLAGPAADAPALYRRNAEIWKHLSSDDWQNVRRAYASRVTEVDAQLGTLIDQIEASGQLDNTIVVVASDHGRHLGAHGLDAHNFGAYEDIYRIPLLVAGPGVAVGATCDEHVGLHELCPTLLEVLGASPIPSPDSQSFAALLSHPEGEGQPRMGYAEYHGARFSLCQRVLWDGDWKFVFNGFDFDELYDLASDLDEMHNRARDPDQTPRVKAMMRSLWQRLQATGDKPLIEGHYYSMQFASVGPLTGLP